MLHFPPTYIVSPPTRGHRVFGSKLHDAFGKDENENEHKVRPQNSLFWSQSVHKSPAGISMYRFQSIITYKILLSKNS